MQKKTNADTCDSSHPPFVCPECDGPLIEFQERDLARFKCKVGHQFSLESLTAGQAEALERGLWIAIRSLEDRAAIHEFHARKYQGENDPERAKLRAEIATQNIKDAKLLRKIAGRI